ncbi:MAG: 50S ribosomal protein L29 [Chloroflexota bacterium]
MATLVEMHEMNNAKLEELLENAREEVFNLRFQRASGQLENYTRLRTVRREIARLETLLHQRDLAKTAALQQPAVATALADADWQADVHFSYEDSAWVVNFQSSDGRSLASAVVNLNQSQSRQKRRPSLVKSYEIA